MKRNLLFALVLASNYVCSAQQAPIVQLKKMEWLIGNWNRTNAKPGKKELESWKRKSESEWTGRALSIQGKDTTMTEKLRIAVEQGKLFYISDVPENKKPVYFEVTTITANGFVCENPKHDFPKKIEYRLEGTQLKARISDGSKGFDYLFEKSN